MYGAYDHDTAEFYSKASGTATVDTDPDPRKTSLRQRPLLTADEIVNPQHGNCTIFSRFVTANSALQVIMQAELTRLYEREDWKTHLVSSPQNEPILLKRGICLSLPDMSKSAAASMFSSVADAESSSKPPDNDVTLPPPSAFPTLQTSPASSLLIGSALSEDELNAIFGSSASDREIAEQVMVPVAETDQNYRRRA